MALLRDINNIIFKTEKRGQQLFWKISETSFPKQSLFFNLGIIGTEVSDFAFERLFMLSSFETTGHTNKTWHHLSSHQGEGSKEIGDVMVTSQLNNRLFNN